MATEDFIWILIQTDYNFFFFKKLEEIVHWLDLVW